jgi:hypothetical protein
LENFKRHEDGTISITLTLFYDRCDNGKRSVEHDTFLIMRAGDALRIDEYLPKGDAELSTDTVAPEVISSHCQQ